MSSIEKPKNLPLGTGKEFLEKRKELTLPALEVKNTVLWVNPAFKNTMPFKIELGKQTNLGIFFTPLSEEDVPKNARHPKIMPEDIVGRSGLEGSVIFQDKDGHFYRDIDLKGIGKFLRSRQEYYVSPVEKDMENSQKAKGLMDREFAERDKLYSEKFLQADIRSHRVLAITELEEIIHNKDKISISQAKQHGIISEEMQPVIAIRAFGTKERIDYILGYTSYHTKTLERKRKSLLDAKYLVAQELGKKPDEFSTKDYLEWLAETLGKQVAKIKKLKLFHGYITPHNITLDCRIVDLDSVQTVREALADKEKIQKETLSIIEDEEDLYKEDYIQAERSINEFAQVLYSDWDKLELGNQEQLFKNNSPMKQLEFQNHIVNIFNRAYQEELKAKQKPKKERGEVEPSSTKQKKAQEKKAA